MPRASELKGVHGGGTFPWKHCVPICFCSTPSSPPSSSPALPQRPPHLTVSTHNLEVGLQGHVHCSLAGLFPAPEAQVRLQLGGRELDTTVTHVEDSVRATASVEVTAEEEGPQPLVCTVLLGTRQQEARTTLTVFSKKGQGGGWGFCRGASAVVTGSTCIP